jgi:HPt (histidine-containing phosphotransfer) domain-containing protein
MSEAPLIDRAVLDELFDSIGAEGARSVLELFIGESRTYLQTIAAATALPSDAGRRERARRAAHSLKSASGQIGAAAMAIAAAAVEQASFEGTPDLAPRLAALDQCARDTLLALAAFLGR